MKRIFTITMIGDNNVGKTSIFRSYVYNQIDYPDFVGILLLRKTITLDGNKIDLELIDAHLSEKQLPLMSISPIRRSNGIFLVYDITSRESFDKLIHFWYKEVSLHVNKQKFVLIGNKCDMECKRAIKYSTGKEFAEGWGMHFIETSARDETNIEQAFVLLSGLIMKDWDCELNIDSTIKLRTLSKKTRTCMKCYC